MHARARTCRSLQALARQAFSRPRHHPTDFRVQGSLFATLCESHPCPPFLSPGRSLTYPPTPVCFLHVGRLIPSARFLGALLANRLRPALKSQICARQKNLSTKFNFMLIFVFNLWFNTSNDAAPPRKAAMTKTTHPSKEQVRELMARRRQENSAPLSIEEVRRQLGWHLVEAARDGKSDSK